MKGRPSKEYSKYDKSVLITEDDNKFIFIVESTGAIQPVEIVSRAMKVLKEKILKF